MIHTYEYIIKTDGLAFDDFDIEHHLPDDSVWVQLKQALQHRQESGRLRGATHLQAEAQSTQITAIASILFVWV